MLIQAPGASRADSRLFGDRVETHSHGLLNARGQFDAANSALQKRVGEFLARKYPGHPWAISAEIEHGILKIAIQGFVQWPYVVKVSDLKADPGMHIIMRAAGEILERLKMPRTGFSMADWRGALHRLPMHLNRTKNPDKVIG